MCPIPGGMRITPIHFGPNRCLLSLLIAVVVLAPKCLAQGVASLEYRKKAHFLANAPSVVEWPETAFDSQKQPISICVFGDFSFGTSLAANARGLLVGGRPLEVRWIRKETDLSSCRVLFISRSEAPRYNHILSVVSRAPVLTVGETEDFLKSGGIIALTPAGETLQFDVNLAAAFASHLRISSAFLALAHRVIREPEAARS